MILTVLRLLKRIFIDYLINSEFSKYFEIEKQKPHIKLLEKIL